MVMGNSVVQVVFMLMISMLMGLAISWLLTGAIIVFKSLIKNGQFIHKFGTQGNGTGQFQNPWGIFLNSKREIVVSESTGKRLQIFDYNGNHLRFIAVGQISYPGNIFIDSSDHIYVGSHTDNTIKVFDGNTGQLIHSFGQGHLHLIQFKYHLCGKL